MEVSIYSLEHVEFNGSYDVNFHLIRFPVILDFIKNKFHTFFRPICTRVIKWNLKSADEVANQEVTLCLVNDFMHRHETWCMSSELWPEAMQQMLWPHHLEVKRYNENDWI